MKDGTNHGKSTPFYGCTNTTGNITDLVVGPTSESTGQLIIPGSNSQVTVDLSSRVSNNDSIDAEASQIIEVESKRTPFKTLLPYEERQKLYNKVSLRFPGRIPVICEPSRTCHLRMDRIKFICPPDIPLGHFLVTIRKRIPELNQTEAMFLLVNNTSPCNSDELGLLYDRYKEEDGFLYITYSTENTFG